MIAHFFDLDVLIYLDSSVWIVPKTNPTDPIIKISQSEFNLIKNGIYKKFNTSLKLAGKEYWLPENLYNTLKIRCKKLGFDFSDLAFSMQEFMNPELIDRLDWNIQLHNFQHLKNSNDDIYIICSKSTKRAYEPIIKKLEEKLFELGLKPKQYYYISETFYNRDGDDISHKKVRLLLQHLVGFKTDSDKFTDEEITKYQNIFFYDDERRVIQLSKSVNSLLDVILSNTDNELKEVIKNEIKRSEHKLFVNEITNNKVEPFFTTEVILETGNLIKTFEAFRWRY